MHVQEEVFRQQIAELQRRFRFIALGDLVERMEGGESIDGYLALTFDDAYVGVLRYAAPFLVDRGIPATVFVTAEASESQAPFWWDSLELVREGGPAGSVARLAAELGVLALEEHPDLYHERLRRAVLERWAGQGERVVELLGSPPATRFGDDWRAAGPEELERLEALPGMQFAGHTLTHRSLAHLSAEEQEREIQEGQAWLERRFSKVVPWLGYPYGLYTEDTVRAAGVAGIRYSFAIEPYRPARPDLPAAVPRLCMTENTDSSAVEGRLSALHRIVKRRVRCP